MSLPEQDVWEDEVAELGVGDFAVGGRGGLANRQAQQLANRTAWLRARIDELAGQRITGVALSEAGHLVFTFANEEVLDLGSVIGPAGIGMPAGGLVGQMPVKQSLADYDFAWVDRPLDGVSIVGAGINGSGHLIISLSDGQQVDAGVLPGGGVAPPTPIDLTPVPGPLALELAAIPGNAGIIDGNELSAVADPDEQVLGAAFFNARLGTAKFRLFIEQITTPGTDPNDAHQFGILEAFPVTQFAVILSGGAPGVLLVQEGADSPAPMDSGYLGSGIMLEVDPVAGSARVLTENVPAGTSYTGLAFSPTQRLGCGLQIAAGSTSQTVRLRSPEDADLPGWYTPSPDFPPLQFMVPPPLPPETKVGDTFFVENEGGGSFNGIAYEGPDEAGNFEGFQVASLEPLKIIPIKKGSTTPPAPAYVPELLVTVGPGQDYESWDEAYAAVAPKRIGVLAINLSGVHENEALYYGFNNCGSFILNADSAEFTDGIFIAGPEGVGDSSFSGYIKSQGGAPHIIGMKNFSITGTSQLEAGFVYIENCSSFYSGYLTLNAISGLSQIAGKLSNNNNYQNIIIPYGGVSLIGDVSISNIMSAAYVICGGGTIRVNQINSDPPDPRSTVVLATRMAKVELGNLECGTAGADYAIEVEAGSTVFVRYEPTGTVTQLYSQGPFQQSLDGLIVTAASGPSSLTVDAGEGNQIHLTPTAIHYRQGDYRLALTAAALGSDHDQELPATTGTVEVS